MFAPLGDLSPLVLQSQLVRLCKDEALARALWENIITNRLSDSQFHYGYPWVLPDDFQIVGLLSAEDVIDRATTDSSSYVTSAHHLLDVWDSLRMPVQTRVVEVDTSSTGVDIDIEPITINYVDLLLGPCEPRFQVTFADTRVNGGFAHYGIYPDLLSSVYSVVSSLAGSATMQCVYFNTEVGTVEPFIEPYTIGFSVRKSRSDDTLAIEVSDSGLLVCNISATFLQTVTSIGLGLNQTSSFKYFPEDPPPPTDDVRELH